jgi:hypothetical protein
MMTVLSDLAPENEERDALRLSLVAERYELNLRCQGFIDEEVSSARDRLLAEHERVKGECRAQETRIGKLKTVIIGLKRELYRLRGVTAEARTTATAVEADLLTVSRFATAKQIKAAERAAEAARVQAEQAAEAEAPVFEQIRYLDMTELARENQILAELAQEELELDAAISGKPFTDKFGFIHAARPAF